MAVKFNINIKELKKITRKLNIDLNNKTQRLSESVKDLQDKMKSNKNVLFDKEYVKIKKRYFLVLIEEYVILAKPINTNEVMIKNEKCIKCKYSKNGVMISKTVENYKEFVVNKKLQDIGLMEMLYPFVSSFNSGSELSSKIIILRSGLNIGYVIKKENNELTYCGYVPLKTTKIRDLDLAGALQPCEILPMSDQKIISLLKTETNEKTRLELEKYYALKNKEYYNSNYDSNFVYVKQKRM